MKKWMIVPALAFLSGLSGCQHKDTGFAFTTQHQYRHRLFTGGYEFIKFKPDGTVYVEMRHDGINVRTNGTYALFKTQHGPFYRVNVALESGPRRNIEFSGIPDNTLVDDQKSQAWKLHRVLSPTSNELM
ncbi:hypothetical protein [Spirosoma sp. KUDC1026]|uniref:hypothetical protein n=1 Tax=Spirosoma sp. KUDC1026 TaxID=2745947 RepID=UPI00159BA1E8|nr:hypothetical protein [Spirosoma sp. KUDC1026]QKZ12474.1 hypothetical protein HU175_07465 [Spirosoma sp. KUDC1026]